MQSMICYVTHDRPAVGAWNMAVDEARLMTAASVPDSPLRLRFYEWSEPTLSLGYFQHLSDRSQHAASTACPIVRRASGGGAIVHDRELTYSLAVSAGHQLARDPQGLYSTIHSTLVAALAELGVKAEELRSAVRTGQTEPFLCFQRAASGDVFTHAVDDPGRSFKVCGSAQRRRRGAVLQHGSVLISRSGAAPELPGIVELSGTAISPSQLAVVWQGQLKLLCGWSLQSEVSGEPAEMAAVENALVKYVDPEWTARR